MCLPAAHGKDSREWLPSCSCLRGLMHVSCCVLFRASHYLGALASLAPLYDFWASAVCSSFFQPPTPVSGVTVTEPFLTF